MSTRRLLVCLGALLVSVATPLAAQGRAGAIPGMDMSNAPADIQAIMKKVMSGGIPTQDEAKRLGEYMAANKGAIAKNATAYGDSMKKQAAAAKTLMSGTSDQNACPAKVALAPTLAMQPTSKIATALLDSIRQAYAAKLKPQSLSMLQSALAKVSDPAALGQIAVALLLKGYPELAILTYVSEVQRTPAGGAQDAWAALGAGLIAGGDALPAIPVVRYALSLGVRKPLYVEDLGVAYANAGDLTTAATLLEEAIRLDPSSGQAYDALGRVQSCQGNMTLAAASMKKAQDNDWSRERQKTIDDHDKQDSQNANDDAAEAAQELPEPPGRSPFPPPPGGGRPSNFNAYSPKIPADYREAAAAQRYNSSMMVSYQDLIRQLAGQPNKKPPSTPSQRVTGTIVIRYTISNGDQAIAGAAVVARRTAARVNRMHVAFNDKYQSIFKQMNERASPIEAAYFKCDKVHDSQCFAKYCRAMKPVITEGYAAMAGNTNIFIGGLAGLAEKFSTTINHWFYWAGDPGSRKVIDTQRRYYLADFQVEAFSAASVTAAAMPNGCEEELAKKPAGKGTLDAEQDPGACTSRSIKLPYFASMHADCHEMTMSIDFPPITELLGGSSPTLDIRRASGDKFGKFFIGVSNDLGHGAVSYNAGMQVTWDQGGWVKGAGPAVSASAEDMNGLVHVGGELMANGLSQGPTMQGSLGGSIPTLGVAPNVSFGGKY